MPTLDLGAKSHGNGSSILAVAPYVKPNGEPAVIMFIKKSANGVFDSTLDGEPALAVVLGEDAGSNGPWVLGDLFVQHWEEAKKLAHKT
jgi:hypothetical protein